MSKTFLDLDFRNEKERNKVEGKDTMINEK